MTCVKIVVGIYLKFSLIPVDVKQNYIKLLLRQSLADISEQVGVLFKYH